ncbi:MAG TPA: corrinoid protein [Spirochaetota bacterium]|nr:corrinoid protein [Spirochaetota bacterium]HQO03573.1 corrinoid protein [Spirochaetota bacterium]HQP49727.1 corrinoid protein [Spirochaetota bacterium]
MELLQEIAVKVEEGKHLDVVSLVEKCIEAGIGAGDILNKGLVEGMNSIGIKFRNNEVFVPEVLVAARAMKAGLEVVKPVLLKEKVQSKGTIVIGTVMGDLHDIGKNIVCYMLQGAGYDVVDIGIDVSKEKFIEEARSRGAQIIGLSSLLTTTMTYMKDVMDAVRNSDIAENVRVIVGGAPVTREFADQIGAHGYAADAASAVDVVKVLLQA